MCEPCAVHWHTERCTGTGHWACQWTCDVLDGMVVAWSGLACQALWDIHVYTCVWNLDSCAYMSKYLGHTHMWTQQLLWRETVVHTCVNNFSNPSNHHWPTLHTCTHTNCDLRFCVDHFGLTHVTFFGGGLYNSTSDSSSSACASLTQNSKSDESPSIWVCICTSFATGSESPSIWVCICTSFATGRIDGTIDVEASPRGSWLSSPPDSPPHSARLMTDNTSRMILKCSLDAQDKFQWWSPGTNIPLCM